MRKSSILSILGVIALAVALVPRWTVEASKPVPIIVAKQAFLGQTTAIGTTTLFTPSADGDYRVSYYASAVANTCAGPDNFRPQVVFGWTDDVQAESITIAWQDDGGSRNCVWDQRSKVIHATSGNAITVATTLNNSIAGNLYFTVEEL